MQHPCSVNQALKCVWPQTRVMTLLRNALPLLHTPNHPDATTTTIVQFRQQWKIHCPPCVEPDKNVMDAHQENLRKANSLLAHKLPDPGVPGRRRGPRRAPVERERRGICISCAGSRVTRGERVPALTRHKTDCADEIFKAQSPQPRVSS